MVHTTLFDVNSDTESPHMNNPAATILKPIGGFSVSRQGVLGLTLSHNIKYQRTGWRGASGVQKGDRFPCTGQINNSMHHGKKKGGLVKGNNHNARSFLPLIVCMASTLQDSSSKILPCYYNLKQGL